MFHISNLGSFGNQLRPYADLDGQIAQEGDQHESMRWDAMTEWSEDSWDEHVATCIKLTKQANAGVAEWRERGD